MNARKLFVPFLGTLLLGCLLSSCGDGEEVGKSEEFLSLRQCVEQGCLLLTTDEQADQTVFTFENQTITVPADLITLLDKDTENWTTRLTCADGSVLTIPTLGKSLHLTAKNIEVNPTGYAPCSAQLTVSFPVEGRVKVCVKGKHGPQGDLSHLFSKYGYNHQEYIHGLYRDFENTIYVTFTDMNGKERLTDSLKVTTTTPADLVPQFFSACQLVASQPGRMEPGVTIVQDQGGGEYDAHRAYMLDCEGEVRWYLWLRNHPKLNICAHCGFKRVENGNFIAGDARSGNLFEFDMVGNLVKEWDIAAKGYEFHHDLVEMPNGNLLVTVTNKNSKNSEGGYTRYDYVIEVHRETGNLVTEWDLKKCLDPTRSAMLSEQDMGDFKHNWAHGNAVAYSSGDDCILVSTRYQGLVKLTQNNQLVWFLTPYRETAKVAGALLVPLDAGGLPITDKEALDGKKYHPDFDWVWGAHCPVLLENGHILIFDNGYYRRHEEIDLFSTVGYSRAVEYEINDKVRTVRQVWEYGHQERGRGCYSVALSSVQYLSQTDHVLFGPGVGTPNKNGAGGKIIEVDYKTKEVVYEVHLSRPDYLVFHRVARLSLYPGEL